MLEGRHLKASAKWYANYGCSVIPLEGKKPLISWERYQKERATIEQIEAWWSKWPLANVGIVTGKISGLIVLDIDGPAGEQTLKDQKLHLPPTITTKTGGDGWHYYFKYPDFECNNFAGRLPGIDFRGDGGYVVAPPSYHPNGTKYDWAISPKEETPAEAPGWLLKLIREEGDVSALLPEAWTDDVTEGGRNDHLARLAGSLLSKMSKEDALPMLLAWNDARCKPPLPEKEIALVVKSIAKRAAKKQEEEQIRQTSFANCNSSIFEQIYTDGQVAFIHYDVGSGDTEAVDYFMDGDIRVTPIIPDPQNDELAQGAVRLPSGVEEYGDTLTLLKEVEDHIYHWLDVSNSFRKFAAYYVLLSWLYDKFNTLPYLRFIGDTGCGKSRALDVTGGLCYKNTLASGCVTPAPIYRMIRKWSGTMMLDEADIRDSDEYSEVTTILNCGFERGRPVIRSQKERPDNLQFLPTFGPKVFATRQRFKDPALEARCLSEIMQETDREDIPVILNRKFHREQESLRNKLLLFRFRNYHSIDPDQSAEMNLHGIEPRLRQVSSAFGVLFANQPEIRDDYQVFIKEHQRELIEQRLATPTGRVVEALFELLKEVTVDTDVTADTGDNVIKISPGDIAEKVNMTPPQVGRILKTLGLHTKVKKVAGESKRCIVYNEKALRKLERRYIPEEALSTVYAVTSETTVTEEWRDVEEMFQ